MKKQDPLKRQIDDVRILFAEAKIRNNLDDNQLARYLGISDRTLRERKSDPLPLSLDKLFHLLTLAGKKIKFVDKDD